MNLTNQQSRLLGSQPLKTKIHLHPNLFADFGNVIADIALLRIDNAFTITEDVQTIGIPDRTISIGRAVKLASSLVHDASPPHDSSSAPDGLLNIWSGSISEHIPDSSGTGIGTIIGTSIDDMVRQGDSGSGVLTVEVSTTGARRAVVAGLLSSFSESTPHEFTATNVALYKTWILAEMNLSESQVDGNVRMTRLNLTSEEGSMHIDCYNELGYQVSADGPLDVDGAELRLYCYNTDVTSTCDLEEHPAREIGTFSSYYHDSDETVSLPHSSDKAYFSEFHSFGVNTHTYLCELTLPPALIVAAIL